MESCSRFQIPETSETSPIRSMDLHREPDQQPTLLGATCIIHSVELWSLFSTLYWRRCLCRRLFDFFFFNELEFGSFLFLFWSLVPEFHRTMENWICWIVPELDFAHTVSARKYVPESRGKDPVDSQVSPWRPRPVEGKQWLTMSWRSMKCGPNCQGLSPLTGRGLGSSDRKSNAKFGSVDMSNIK